MMRVSLRREIQCRETLRRGTLRRETLRRDAQLGLMGHLIADYPSPEAARQMVGVMAGAGVEVIEIQIPFSEPMADGEVFRLANHQALKQGVTFQAAMTLMTESAQLYPQVDFIFMSYLNPIYRRGYRQFVGEAVAAGARGIIIPDLPKEHDHSFQAACQDSGFQQIKLIAPTTGASRLAAIGASAEGLLYVVARRGVTGGQTVFNETLTAYLAKVRQLTAAPVALGFGLKAPEDVAFLKGKADLAVIGTGAYQVWQESGLAGYQKFWQKMAEAAV